MGSTKIHIYEVPTQKGEDGEYQYLMVTLNHLVSSFVCNGWAIHHHFMYESVNPLTNQEHSIPRGTSPLQTPPVKPRGLKGLGNKMNGCGCKVLNH